MNDEISAIIIDVKDYREHDAILHALCMDGTILHLVARGIKKVNSKNAAACQLFTYAQIQLNYRETAAMQMLKTAIILHSYRVIREDLLKQSIASFVCECIDKSAFDENVFTLLKETLDILAETSHPWHITCLFQAVMNRMHGIEPHVESCVRCGKQQGIYAISIRDGGFVCKRCYRNGQDQHKTIHQLKCFRLLCKADIAHYETLEAHVDATYEDFEQLYAFFEDYAGIYVKSIRFLRCLMHMEGDLE